MRNKQADDWVSENMVLTDEDKRQCIGIVNTLLEIAIQVRKQGLLSIDEQVPKLHNMFLQKALALALDAVPPAKLRETLQNEFIEAYKNGATEKMSIGSLDFVRKENRNRELFKRVLITEGVTEIVKGSNPIPIAIYLASFFGEDYFKRADEL